MLIVSYDISNTKIRTRFSKFLLQYGRRLQYSVYELSNSKRILKNIQLEINQKYESQFTNEDSVIIFDLTHKKIYFYGYSKNERKDLLFFD